MKKLIFISLVSLLALSLGCNKDADKQVIACQQQVTISADEFDAAPNDHLTINHLAINGNCLKIYFSAGGCTGETWELKLIDSAKILYSNPPQRNLRLSLKNEELCDALISKELTFDISGLQGDGNSVLLNINNSGDQILYTY